MKETIPRWKKTIIRWSLRQLKPILPALYKCNLEKISEFGIEDMSKNEHTGDIAIYID